MRHRGYFSAEERQIRSRLAQIVSQKEIIRAGIVKMTRRCGKVNCWCAKDKGHVSYYLSMREGSRRKMVYIPASMESKVREWVRSYKEVNKAIDQLSVCRLKQIRQGVEHSSAATKIFR